MRREQRLFIAVWATRAAFGVVSACILPQSMEGNVEAVLLAELSQQQLRASSVASPLLPSRAGTFIQTKLAEHPERTAQGKPLAGLLPSLGQGAGNRLTCVSQQSRKC